VFICIALVLSVLLQSAKGEGLAGAFGGTSLTGTVFGGRGAASFLSKATTVLAVAFMSSCIILTFINPSTGTSSVLEGTSAVQEAAQEAPAQAPATTAQPATQDGATQSTGQPPAGPEDELFQQPASDQGTPAGEGTDAGQGTSTEQPQGGATDQPDQSGDDNP
jgi:preprotein translocase subunit SecG